jgi:glycosyltransferase involved in cell wall biosynthesis
MDSKPLVSVITIFFNAERFIEEAIESVFAQTYENWELLLVDDGSTDISTETAMRYSKKYPEKVRYLEHECHQNRGMSASRNLGLYHAKGDYIALLDSDDVWFSHKLEQQVTILSCHPEAAMVYGNRQYWYSWTGNVEDVQRDSTSKSGIEPNTLVKPPLLLTLTYGMGTTTHPGSDSMFRREMAIRLGGFEETFRGMFEDQIFLVKVFINETVYISDQCWTKYRQHSGSCCSRTSASGRVLPSWLSFMNWVESYLSKQGLEATLEGTPLWKSFQSHVWPHRHPIRFQLLRFSQLLARHALPIPIRGWLRTRLPLPR